ncbi:MAG: TatD family hydrolase [Deltaproteobacteria bacterium]|nr:TatD family hydrolase [Deltaproteobacteria bacterium]
MSTWSVMDTHCHLDFEDFGTDLPAVIERARQARVARMICIGAGRDIASARGAVALSEKEPDIHATVGVHPHDAAVMTEATWDELENLAIHPKVVGIGESGLDYFYDQSPRELQQVAYRRFIGMARRHRLAIISHVRDAHADAQAILKETAAHELRGIIHCFTGNADDARAYLDLGQYLSFSGILTFRNAEPVREAARFAPMDRILVETDAPYLAPIPHRGKRNEPAYVLETLRFLAELKGLPLDEVAAQTWANSERVFGFADDHG